MEPRTGPGWMPGTYGEAFADVYDEWYSDVSDLDGTVATVVALGGPVLELGIGTGRVALALVAAGLEVHGVDSSPAMVAQLRAKPAGQTIEVLVADMAESLPEGPFTTVLAAYNTLFNLPDHASQLSCLRRCAAVCRPGGHLVIESSVVRADERDDRVRVRSLGPDHLGLSATVVDPERQVAMGQFVTITADGITMRPWRICWTTPDDLDRLCDEAGFDLVSRAGGWRGEPFDATCDTHVSAYRRRPG
jgi:SAM-dependent methyltransferase